jgi:predicted nucleic acid-binding protein
VILIDTSIWIDHLHRADPVVTAELGSNHVLGHPFVTGEIALGNLQHPRRVLVSLHQLPQAPVASNNEVLEMITRNGLAGSGIGYVDAHLLTAARLLPGAKLWTRDRRLQAVAERLGLAARPMH